MGFRERKTGSRNFGFGKLVNVQIYVKEQECSSLPM